MKAITEHFVVAVIAVVMAFIGYWLIGWHERQLYSGQQQFDWMEDGALAYPSVISVVVWMILYRVCRRLHWLVLPVIGVFSPLIGAVLFFIPWTLLPFYFVLKHAVVVFPTGIACGFFISVATLPFRPKTVCYRNAE
jgi:hypothetical protein